MPLAIPLSIALGRFKQLPQRSQEVWQGGLVRLPMWIDNPAGPNLPPNRPVGAVWVSVGLGLAHFDLPKDGNPPDADLALAALLEFGFEHKRHDVGRPSRIEVSDPALRDTLAQALSTMNTTVVLVPDLPVLRGAIRSLEMRAGRGTRMPGLLEAPEVTPDRLLAFAEAAAAFHVARPWDQLANEDLMVVESPASPRGMQHLSILGQGGQQFGMAFHASRKEFEHMLDPAHVNRRPPSHAKGVTFGPKYELPFADVDAWDDLALPVAASNAYPLPGDLFVDGHLERPAVAELRHMEALLRVLTVTTEDELDAGRWTRTVQTHDGPIEMTLALPFLLEAEAGSMTPPGGRHMTGERVLARMMRLLKDQSFESLDDANAALADAQQSGVLDAPLDAGATPLERAQDLAYQAQEATGRLRVKLARQSLQASADCADAWLVLGLAAPTQTAAIPHFEQAVGAGARAIGADAFEHLVGHFWSHVETRPYMRARLELAQALREAGRADETLQHFRELLRLNPGDNQGVRYLLLPMLLEQGLDGEAAEWLEQYPEDIGATIPYARLLLRFRREGDTPRTRAALDEAVAANPHVIDHLLDPASWPIIPFDHFAPGSPEEAGSIAPDLLAAFERAPGALEWLGVHGPVAVRARQRHARRKPVRRARKAPGRKA